MTNLLTGRGSIYMSPRQQKKHDKWLKQQQQRQRQRLLANTKRINKSQERQRQLAGKECNRTMSDDIYIDKQTKQPRYADIDGVMYKLVRWD